MKDNMYNKRVGNFGEMLALNYLESLNYKILDRNFNTSYGEIDIIAKEKNEYVFIEVKTRTSKNYGRPADAVDFKKKKHIQNASKIYIYKHKLEDKYIRYDIVEVYFIDECRYYINHLRNNFF